METKDTKVQGLVGESMSKIHEMADANTVLGDPIKVDDVTIIPISKVSYGYAGGGSDLPNKNSQECFGGAAGAGMTFQPLGFLVVSDGDVRILQLNLDQSSSSAIVNMVPEVFNKISSLFGKKKDKDLSKDETVAEAVDELKAQTEEVSTEVAE